MADLRRFLQPRLSGLCVHSAAWLYSRPQCPRQTALPGSAPGARLCTAASTVSMDIINCIMSWLRRSDFGNKALTKRKISAASSTKGTVSSGKTQLHRGLAAAHPTRGQDKQEGVWEGHIHVAAVQGSSSMRHLGLPLLKSCTQGTQASNDLNAFVHSLIQLTVPEHLAALGQLWGIWRWGVTDKN